MSDRQRFTVSKIKVCQNKHCRLFSQSSVSFSKPKQSFYDRKTCSAFTLTGYFLRSVFFTAYCPLFESFFIDVGFCVFYTWFVCPVYCKLQHPYTFGYQHIHCLCKRHFPRRRANFERLYVHFRDVQPKLRLYALQAESYHSGASTAHRSSIADYLRLIRK